MFREKSFYLHGPDGKADFVIERIEILKEITLGEECWFKTISPVYVKTMRKAMGDLTEPIINNIDEYY